MIYQLTNSRGEVIETKQCDITLSSDDVERIKDCMRRLSATFNKLKAEFQILSSLGNKTFSCSQICELVNEANRAYQVSLLLASHLSLIEHNVVDYQLLVDENSIKEANFKALM